MSAPSWRIARMRSRSRCSGASSRNTSAQGQHARGQRQGRRAEDGVPAHLRQRRERLLGGIPGAQDPAGGAQALVGIDRFAPVEASRLDPALEAAQGALESRCAQSGPLQQAARVGMFDHGAVRRHQEQVTGRPGLQSADLAQETGRLQVHAGSQHADRIAGAVHHRCADDHHLALGYPAEERLGHESAPRGHRALEVILPECVEPPVAGEFAQRSKLLPARVQQDQVHVLVLPERRLRFEEAASGGRIAGGAGWHAGRQRLYLRDPRQDAVVHEGGGAGQHRILLVTDHRLHAALGHRQGRQGDQQGGHEYQDGRDAGNAQLQGCRQQAQTAFKHRGGCRRQCNKVSHTNPQLPRIAEKRDKICTSHSKTWLAILLKM